MMTFDLVEDEKTKPVSGVGAKATGLALRDGLVIWSGGAKGNVIRFMPLIVEEEHIDKAIDILERVFRHLQ